MQERTYATPSPRSFACDLATLCAPTLAGLKPASLFRYQPAPGQDAAAMAAAWHTELSPRGVTVQVLKQCPRTGAVLVYVYRPARVAKLLADDRTLAFLAGEGYTPGTADELLDQLAERLCCEGDFPHEIGVFLGYPLSDVVGFIENSGRNFTCCGCWKAYGDPAAARQHFAQLNKCTAVYLRLFHSGTPIQRLAVAACRS